MELHRSERSFRRGAEHPERGATATEYAALLGLIAVVISVGIGLFGAALGTYFTTAATSIRTILGIP
ncbi:Flp family type IVb pilin [Sinomonas sp. P10A9]|uniref:Flp family type IVb pilin n=1 Tax=Sinomonas puerhi TaxID=3238584 RepID=A0AB39KZL9_9MICC